MSAHENEDELVRSVALQNAKSIFLERQRADEELARTKEELEQKTAALAESLAMLRQTISDRERTEQAQARLASIVESSEDAIIGKTLDSRIFSWNGGAERLFGYTAQEVVGQPITLLIPVDRQDEERMILERLRRGERIEHYETVRVSKDGRRIDVSLTVSPVLERDGRVVAASTIARDVTARRRAEQRLVTQYAVTRALAESGTLNEAALRILQAIVEYLGWDIGALWYVDDASAVLRCSEVWHRRSLQSRQFAEICRERTFSRGVGLPGRVWADGTPLWIPDVVHEEAFSHAADAASAGLHSALSVPIMLRTHVLGVMEFFSPEIRPPDDDLLQMMFAVGSQVGQFIERKQAEEALRQSDRHKDEFLAMLAHELRNPLAPIRNAAAIFRRKAPHLPELRWAAEMIDRQVHQMSRLVDDLLDVSRISRGGIELRKERVELATIVDSAVESVRPLIDKWGHRLAVAIPPEPIWLDADQTRLAQVLLNLLTNAAKYTDQGGHIWLTGERHNDEVLISVRDSGVGIPADMLSRIFDLFTQVDRSLERSEGGLGIGLTLVRRLVEMHAGSVEARSDGEGKGSEFLVRLPVAQDLMGTTPRGAHHDEILAPGRRRILVVDDDKDAVDSLAVLLRMMGHQVHTAHDGLEAVGAAAAFQPQVVVLDLGLPKLNGYQVARRIREQVGGAGVMLVALTGRGHENDRRRTKEAGFDHHMTKPVEFEAVQKLLAATDTSPSSR